MKNSKRGAKSKATVDPAGDAATNQPTLVGPEPDADAVTSAHQKTVLNGGDETYVGEQQTPVDSNTVEGRAESTRAGKAVVDTGQATFITQVTEDQTRADGTGRVTARSAVESGETRDPATESSVPGTAEYVPAGDSAGGEFAVSDPTFISESGVGDVRVRRPKQQADAKTKAIGMRIGEYEVLDELGRGGMGVVYKAKHANLNRVAALKMILNGQHATRQHMDRFLTEARAVAALQHPNIVQIFDIGEHEDMPWFTLEFVDGDDLQGTLQGKPQTPDDCATMVETLARAMQYAHDEGIIHRDLKPANVLVSNDGVAKITDFGLAKQLEEGDSEGTRTGTIMGSPSYMSPEQAAGKTEEIGPASDQYSLGAVLYQMITARAPFAAAKPMDTITQVIKNEPIAPRQFQPEVPIDLETICLKALQKEPSARYANCNELADDLRRYINKEPISARPVSGLEKAWKWCKRNPQIAIPSLSSVGLLLLTAVISLWSYATVSAQNDVIEQEKEKVVAQNAIILEEKTKAEQQREIAEAAEILAKENEKQAKEQATLTLKSLQGFISKVDSKLAEKAELADLRIEVLEEISDTWDEIDVAVRDDKEGEAIPTRMGARFKLSQVFQSTGDLQKAYEEGLKLYETGMERQKIRKETDASRLNLARIQLLVMGPLKRQIDRDQKKVLEHYQDAVRLARDVLASPKAGPDGVFSKKSAVNGVLSEALQRCGVSYLFEGDVTNARNTFSEAMVLRESAVRTLKSSDEFKKMTEDDQAKAMISPLLEQDLSILAVAYATLRDEEPEAAIKLYTKAYEGRKAAFEKHPDNENVKEKYAGAAGLVGVAWHWMNQLKEAKKMLKVSEQLFRELYELNTKNAPNKRHYATGRYRLGAVLVDLGETDKAKKEFEACRSLRAELAATGGAEYKQHYMQVLARVGEVDECRKLTEELVKTDKPDADLHLERAKSLAQLVPHMADDKKPAAVTAAIDALNKAIEDGYSDPFKVRVEPDLKPLRSDDRFDKAIKKIVERNAE